jgi:hypothetical protein
LSSRFNIPEVIDENEATMTGHKRESNGVFLIKRNSMNIVKNDRYFNERGKRNAFNQAIKESYASFNTNRSHCINKPKPQQFELNSSRARLTELSPLKKKQQANEFVHSVDGLPKTRKSTTAESLNYAPK